MVDAVSSSLKGLQGASQRLSNAADRISKLSVGADTNTVATQTRPPADIDLNEELVNAKLADISYAANAKVIKAKANTEKDILNILA